MKLKELSKILAKTVIVILTSECQGKVCWHKNKLLSRNSDFDFYILKVGKKMSLNIRP